MAQLAACTGDDEPGARAGPTCPAKICGSCRSHVWTGSWIGDAVRSLDRKPVVDVAPTFNAARRGVTDGPISAARTGAE